MTTDVVAPTVSDVAAGIDELELFAGMDIVPPDTSTQVLSPPRTGESRIRGVMIGRIVGFTELGTPLVEHAANVTGSPVRVCSSTTSEELEVEQEVALLFEEGDPQRPILVGPVLRPNRTPSIPSPRQREAPLHARADGEQLVFDAEKEIVLRCGKASITLTRAGKILIRGAYLSSRSSGVNRIKGGSVQIN